MPSISIVCGILLILIAVLGYVYGAMTGTASLTALIPAIFGVLLAAFGFAAKTRENLRKHLMHASLLVALLGFLATVSSFLQLPALAEGVSDRPAATVARIAMALVCLVFLILGIKSFVDARRNRAV